MSEKRYFETKTVVQKIEVCRSEYCDICGNRIYSTQMYDSKDKDRKFVEFFEITIGHNDWFNDSVESVEKQTCCKKCFDGGLAFKVYADYLNESKTPYHTKYTEIEHHYAYDYGNDDVDGEVGDE